MTEALVIAVLLLGVFFLGFLLIDEKQVSRNWRKSYESCNEAFSRLEADNHKLLVQAEHGKAWQSRFASVCAMVESLDQPDRQASIEAAQHLKAYTAQYRDKCKVEF